MVERQEEIRKPDGSDGLILEAWAQGFMGMFSTSLHPINAYSR
jgi:hypothetical protein